MRKISIRVPDDVVTAYERADANRSELIRRAMIEYLTDGEVDVPADLVTLAERAEAVERGKLPRRRGKFRREMLDFFEDHYESGAVPPEAAEDMAQSWLAEAGIYGEDHLRFAEAILAWYRENWDIRSHERPPWPDPAVIFDRAEEIEVDVNDRLRATVRNAIEQGADPEAIVRRLGKKYPRTDIEAAIQEHEH